jgi:hypothetical protein
MDFPNGVNARFINLKCCIPNGIPTIVIQKSKPKIRCVSEIQTPPHTSHRIFMIVDRQPVFEDVSVIFTPKGASATNAHLKHCSPNGIPTMVRHKIKPPIRYSRNTNIPPKIIQMMLPIRFIIKFFDLDY